MRIEHLEVRGFRGLRRAEVRPAGKSVILVGANGSGKSTILDAIRLFKSVYGAYVQDELQQYLGELQISPQSPQFDSLLHSAPEPARIEIELTIEENERAFIRDHFDELFNAASARRNTPALLVANALGGMGGRFANAERRTQLEAGRAELVHLLAKKTLTGAVTVESRLPPSASANIALTVLFSTYRPEHLGIVDFHGPHRRFARGRVNAIPLSRVDANPGAHALYNTDNKYSNLKGELAWEYLRKFLATAGPGGDDYVAFDSKLRDLFDRFFSPKIFEGLRLTDDGTIDFPVYIAGVRHDLDDLSSGEREMLVGYVRLLALRPKGSILLVDEPELHLNGRMAAKLPGFYRESFIEADRNQLWLATHSEHLLSAARDDEFHIVQVVGPSGPAVVGDPRVRSENQAVDIASDAPVRDLLRQLAGYVDYQARRPILIVEGEGIRGSSKGFDEELIQKLFPEIAAQFRIISGSSKQKVKLYRESIALLENHPAVFSIVDADMPWLERDEDKSPNVFTWEVCHIENHLLDWDILARIASTLTAKSVDRAAVRELMLEHVKRQHENLVREWLQDFASKQMETILDSHVPKKEVSASRLSVKAQEFAAAAAFLSRSSLSLVELETKEAEIRKALSDSLADEKWTVLLRGRELLKFFATRLSISYEQLRNLVVAEMARSTRRPKRMETVLAEVMAALKRVES